MATIVNARDVLLQATSPRVLSVSLPDNIIIPDDKLPQVPTFIGSAKEVVIQSSNRVFQVPLIGAITPANATLTAILRNITGTPTFTVVSGTASLLVTGNTATILPTSMTSTSITVECSVMYNSTLYKDQVTILKAVEGGGVVGALSNEYVTLPKGVDGNIIAASIQAAGGKFQVFDEMVEVTNGHPATGIAPTYSVVSATGVSITIGTDGIYKVNSVTADNATATLRAVFDGVTIDRTYTVKVASIKEQVVGDRGTLTIAREITGYAWTDAEANLAISEAGYGTIIDRDIVTLYNTPAGFSQTKYYRGGQWVDMSAFVDGNMLVKGSVDAEALRVDNLSAISADLGTVTAGTLTAGTVFAGDLNAATGTFSGSLEAATGTFAGTLAAGVLNSSAFEGVQKEWNGAGTYSYNAPALKAGWTAMRCKVTMQGGGGGGGGAAASGAPTLSQAATGGGGGAGTFVSIEFNVTPGAAMTIIVGGAGGGGAATGAQNATAGSGGSGGLSRVICSANGINVTANGGGGGTGAQIPWGTPGAAGIGGSLGGQNGNFGSISAGTYMWGGAGGSTRYGNGGGGNGAGGVGFGTGGGGGYAYCVNLDTINPYNGGPGVGGRVMLEFFDPNMVVLNTRYANLVAWLDGIGAGAVPANAR